MELSSRPLIAASVCADFTNPKSPIGYWNRPAFTATVPETPIQENGEATFPENDIWMARQTRIVAEGPASDTGADEK
jgi:hypothetical protein